MIMPGWSLVLALYSLQNAMMFTPCCPNAGPTGGAGLAWPAGICSLIIPVIFFAMSFLSLKHQKRLSAAPKRCDVLTFQRLTVLTFFHLPVFQFDGCIAPEYVDRHFKLASLRLDFLDHTTEVEEGTVVDLHRFPEFEAHLRLLVILGCRDLALNRLDFFGRGRHWRIAAYEADHSRGFLDEIPRFLDDALILIEQHHINKNIARPEFAGGNRLLLVPHFHY